MAVSDVAGEIHSSGRSSRPTPARGRRATHLLALLPSARPRPPGTMRVDVMVRRPVLRLAPACCVLLAICLAAPPPSARAATPEEIEAAIAKGQEYLLKEMKAPGRWERDAKRNGAGHEW